MRAVAHLIVLLSAVKFGELYHIKILDPNSYVYEKFQDDQGNYKFSNNVFPPSGSYHEETGTVEKSTSGQNNLKVQGQYFYDDGTYRYNVTYVADENGYRARFEKTLLFAAGAVGQPQIGTDCVKSLQGCSFG